MLDKPSLVATIAMVVLLFSQQSFGQVCNCNCRILHERKNVCDELSKLHNKILVNDQHIIREWMPVKEFVKDLQDNFEEKVQSVVSNMPRRPWTGIELDFVYTMRETLSDLANRMLQLEENAMKAESFMKDLQKELSEEKNARNKLEKELAEDTIRETLSDLDNRMLQLQDNAMKAESFIKDLQEELSEEKNARNKLGKELAEEKIGRRELGEKVSEEKNLGETLADDLVKEENERINLQRALAVVRLRVGNVRTRKTLEEELAVENIERRELEKKYPSGKNLTQSLPYDLGKEQREIIDLERALTVARLRVKNLRTKKTLEEELAAENIEIRELEKIYPAENNLTQSLPYDLEKDQKEIIDLQREMNATRLRVENLEAMLSSEQDGRKNLEELLLEGQNKIEILGVIIREDKTKIRSLEMRSVEDQNEILKLKEGLGTNENSIRHMSNLLFEEKNKTETLAEGQVTEQNNVKEIKKLLQEEQKKIKSIEEELLNEKTGRETLEQSFKEEQTKREKLEKGLVQEQNSRNILEDNLNETRNTVVSFGNQIGQFSASAERIISTLPEDFQVFRSSLSTELKVVSQQLNIDTDNLLRNTKYSNRTT